MQSWRSGWKVQFEWRAGESSRGWEHWRWRSYGRNTDIEAVTSMKFLGLIIDDKLSWKCHIDSICRTISRNIGIVNKVKFFLPTSSLLMLYSTLILPYLNYGIIVWGNTYDSYLHRILLLQKKAMRVICNTSWRSHTDVLFVENNVLKINDLYRYSLGQFMYQFNNNTLPSAFNLIFIKNKTIHKYPTRQSDEFHLPLTRTLLAKSIFTYAGPKLWTILDVSIKNAPSLNSFKFKLKKYFLRNYQALALSL